MNPVRRAPFRTIVLLVPLLLAGPACAPGSTDSDVVREPCEPGGAIECVTSNRPVWAPGTEPRVAEAPAVALDRVRPEDPESAFGVIAGTTRLDDGTLVVADAMARQLHFFTSAGDWLASHGRRGEGPGEYLGIRFMDRCWTDRLAVLDRQFLVEVELDGEWIRRRGVVESFDQRPMFVACDGEGHFVGLGIDVAAWRGRVEAGIVRPDGDAVVAEPDSAHHRVLGRFPVGESHERLSDAGFHPLGRVTGIAIGGGSVWVGTADSFEIEQFDLAGAPVRRIVRAWEREDLDPAEVGALLDLALEDLPARAREFWRGRLGPDDNPPSLPAYDALLADEAGRLWVREYVRPGERGNRWSVFAADGRWMGDVALPLDFEPFEIGAGYLLGVSRGALDQPSVTLYELEGSASN